MISPKSFFLDQLILDIDSKSSNQFEGFVGNGWLWNIVLTLVWTENEKKNEWNKEERKIKYSRLHLKWSLVSFRRLFKRWILMQKDTCFANIKMITKYLQSWKIHFFCKDIFIYDIQLKIFFKVCMCGIMYECAKYSPTFLWPIFTEIYEVIFFKKKMHVTIFYNTISLIFFPQKNFWYCMKMLQQKTMIHIKLIFCPILHKVYSLGRTMYILYASTDGMLFTGLWRSESVQKKSVKWRRRRPLSVYSRKA